MAEPVPEDQNLDDFFAKKDKTKKKAKSRFTTDDIEVMMEKKLKKKSAQAKKKEKDSSNSAQTSVLDVKIEDDGEWKEVEEESEKDLSDLRIQNLKISGKEDDDKDRQDNGLSGDDGDDRDGKDGPQGPWKSIPSSAPAVASNTVVVVEKVPEREPEREREAPKASGTGKYVPPGARRAAQVQQMPAVTSIGPGSRRQKTAPNFNSQDDFPSLGAAATDQGEFSGQDFEKVKGGGRQIEDPANRHVKLSLGNKYGALEGKDS